MTESFYGGWYTLNLRPRIQESRLVDGKRGVLGEVREVGLRITKRGAEVVPNAPQCLMLLH